MTAIEEYLLPHGVTRARQVLRDKKPLFYLGDQLVPVEVYARSLFEERGYSVFAGTDAHLFFSVLSYNFADSFFLEVCRNYVGPEAEQLLASLDSAVHTCLDTGRFEPAHLDLALAVLSRYYSEYEPKLDVHNRLCELLRASDRAQMASIIAMYRDAGYTTKGPPDLFLVKGAELRFVEVKSEKDFPTSEQYDFFERFIRYVGPAVMLLRVLPEGVPSEHSPAN